jgi:hypothetical protein
VFDPQTREQANQKPRVLICDGFGSHETLEAQEPVPRRCKYRRQATFHLFIQPCKGEGVHGEKYYEGMSGLWFVSAQSRQSPQGDTEAPTQSTIPRADEIRVGSCHQDGVLQTPVTPVSAEGLVSLHNLIKQDAHTLDETSIQRLERHILKLIKTA